jgi:hypothetical protein
VALCDCFDAVMAFRHSTGHIPVSTRKYEVEKSEMKDQKD